MSMLKFIVLSDLHLGPPGQAVNGLDTAERLSLAVDSINRDHADADFVMLAGDLADRAEPEAYASLRAIMAPLAVPHFITIGNHDQRAPFLEAFPEARDDPQGRISQVVDAKGYRIILLDSTEPGTHGGALCQGRLTWLRDRLAEASDRPVIVVLHHHANDLMLPVDTIKLREAADFVAVLKTHPDVRQVIAGHVHLTTTGLWHGIAFTTIAGSHYNVDVRLTGSEGKQRRLEGPAQYAVVLGDADATLVHFHNYIDRHLDMAGGLFH